jgi:hypothetical protein
MQPTTLQLLSQMAILGSIVVAIMLAPHIGGWGMLVVVGGTFGVTYILTLRKAKEQRDELKKARRAERKTGVSGTEQDLI